LTEKFNEKIVANRQEDFFIANMFNIFVIYNWNVNQKKKCRPAVKIATNTYRLYQNLRKQTCVCKYFQNTVTET